MVNLACRTVYGYFKGTLEYIFKVEGTSISIGFKGWLKKYNTLNRNSNATF